ncbi:DUF5522 domain-containing protein [Eisenibacter elegans]|uniref:DUF5522 domain-containing protein n=1 Tax=Eisenibacter elegans TaxID=997 RepID=UPI0003FB8131|nr:DUF5522 domain-containing protein [Eisenibacter elegans]
MPHTEKQPLTAEDYYYDPRGFKVFTEQYLLKRGHCCKNNCRHCPYSIRHKKG